MALSAPPRENRCVRVSKRITARASSVSPRVATRRKASVPMTGYPVTVVSTVTNASRTVSIDTTFCSGQSAGHPAVPFSSSLHATMVPTAHASSDVANNRLRKPYTPSFDVKAVYDTHDDCVDRAVLGHRREARRAPGRIENDFAQPRTYTIDSDDVPAFATEIGREVFDDQQLERVERGILSRRNDGTHDASELHW